MKRREIVRRAIKQGTYKDNSEESAFYFEMVGNEKVEVPRPANFSEYKLKLKKYVTEEDSTQYLGKRESIIEERVTDVKPGPIPILTDETGRKYYEKDLIFKSALI